MTEAAQIHALMTENGPRLELAEVTASEEHGQWTLVVDEATVLFADWDEERQCVWLSAEVGAPAAGDQLRLYELLLVYNNGWAETGGIRMALDEAGGSVVMTYDLPAAGAGRGPAGRRPHQPHRQAARLARGRRPAARPRRAGDRGGRERAVARPGVAGRVHPSLTSAE